MFVAGIHVEDRLILELVRLLRDLGASEAAERLEHAYDESAKVVALTIPDREDILAALVEPLEGLAELRGVLLREHEWRRRQGLS